MIWYELLLLPTLRVSVRGGGGRGFYNNYAGRGQPKTDDPFAGMEPHGVQPDALHGLNSSPSASTTNTNHLLHSDGNNTSIIALPLIGYESRLPVSTVFPPEHIHLWGGLTCCHLRHNGIIRTPDPLPPSLPLPRCAQRSCSQHYINREFHVVGNLTLSTTS